MQDNNVKTDLEDRLEVSLYSALEVLKVYKIVVSTVTLFFVIGSIFYALSLEKFYKSNLLMMPAQGSSGSSMSLSGLLGGIQNNSTGSISSGPTQEESMAVLKSRLFIESFIEEKDLLPFLFFSNWDEQNKSWTTEEEPSLRDGYELILNSLKFDFDQGLITVTSTSNNPRNSSELVNLIIASVNDHIRKKYIAEAKESIFFLESEIGNTSLAGPKQVLYSLVERQTQSLMLANTRKDYAFKIIDPAREPIHPAGPNRRIIVLISSILGFGVAIFCALFINFYSSRKLSN